MPDYTPELVSKMLDDADFNPDENYGKKRRDAYVTEWYFEEHILPRIAQGITSTGWCYVEIDWVRQWFKVIADLDACEAELETDKQMKACLLSGGEN